MIPVVEGPVCSTRLSRITILPPSLNTRAPIARRMEVKEIVLGVTGSFVLEISRARTRAPCRQFNLSMMSSLLNTN